MSIRRPPRKIEPQCGHTFTHLLSHPQTAVLTHVERLRVNYASHQAAPVSAPEKGWADMSKGLMNAETVEEVKPVNNVNALARQNVEFPLENEDVSDLVSWYAIHHAETENLPLMQKAHRYREAVWNFVANRMAYAPGGGRLKFNDTPDLDVVGDKSYEIRDYKFEYQDPETLEFLAIECEVFNGSKALAAGSKSTRTPQSDIDASYSIPHNLSDRGVEEFKKRFLDAIKDVRIPAGLSLDTNFYLQFMIQHPTTRSIDSLDMVTAEALTRFESKERRVNQVKAFMLKTAVQIGGMDDDLSKLASGNGLLEVARNAARWYEALHTTSPEMDKEAMWSSTTAFIGSRRDLELQLYQDQFEYGLDARTAAVSILNGGGGAQADALFNAYTAFSLMRYEPALSNILIHMRFVS